MNTENHSSTVQKALELLKLFARSDRLSFAELQKLLGMNKSTLSRFISTLVHNGFLRKDASGLYELGLTMFTLGNRATVEDQLRSISQPIMQGISEKLDATVHLGILDALEVIIIAKANPRRRIQMMSRVGSSVPPHCTGQGKTLLAYSPVETVKKVIAAKGMKRYTPNTITSLDGLFEDFEAIHRRGYVIDNSEHESGIKCVAVPILNRDKVVAALSVTAMMTDFPDDQSLVDAFEVIAGGRDEIRQKMAYA